MSGWESAALSELEARGAWIPIRRHFGVAAFGVNAWTGDEGTELVGEHDEVPTGHEELYVVLAGRARFAIDGDELDAPTGTVVFVADPAAKRRAEAAEPGTTILSVGAKPGEAFSPRPWEENAEVFPLFETGEYERARELLLQAIEAHPGNGTLRYNLACAESRLGRPADAVAALAQAVELEERLAGLAQDDPDLEAIRGEAGFPAVPA